MSLKFEAAQRPVSALRCSHRFSPDVCVTLVGDSDDELYVEVGSRIQTTSEMKEFHLERYVLTHTYLESPTYVPK